MDFARRTQSTQRRSVSRRLGAERPCRSITEEQLLQGPFADAMTHAGQLGVLRRLAGSPVALENFVGAAVAPANIGPEQPDPISPDATWPEAALSTFPTCKPFRGRESLLHDIDMQTRC